MKLTRKPKPSNVPHPHRPAAIHISLPSIHSGCVPSLTAAPLSGTASSLVRGMYNLTSDAPTTSRAVVRRAANVPSMTALSGLGTFRQTPNSFSRYKLGPFQPGVPSSAVPAFSLSCIFVSRRYGDRFTSTIQPLSNSTRAHTTTTLECARTTPPSTSTEEATAATGDDKSGLTAMETEEADNEEVSEITTSKIEGNTEHNSYQSMNRDQKLTNLRRILNGHVPSEMYLDFLCTNKK